MLLLVATVLPVAGTMKDSKNVVENQNQDPLESELQYGASSWEDEWPMMFQHDPNITRYSTSKAPQTNTVKWIYPTNYYVFGNPAVANGKVYFGLQKLLLQRLGLR